MPSYNDVGDFGVMAIPFVYTQLFFVSSSILQLNREGMRSDWKNSDSDSDVL